MKFILIVLPLLFILFNIQINNGFEVRYLVFDGLNCGTKSTDLKYVISSTKCSNFGNIIINNKDFYGNSKSIKILKNIKNVNDCINNNNNNIETASVESSQGNYEVIEKELNKCYNDLHLNESYYYQTVNNGHPIEIDSFCAQVKHLEGSSSCTDKSNYDENYMILSHKNGSCQQLLSSSSSNNSTTTKLFSKLYCIGDKTHEYLCKSDCNEDNNCEMVKSYLSNQNNIDNNNSCYSKGKPIKLSKNLIIRQQNDNIDNSNSSNKLIINLFLLALEIIIIINIINYI